MSSVFNTLKFRFEWRDYQKKVLENFDGYLADRRLHVVAAPGSGKTILGLEVMRRIAKPTLILAPTIIIRDQWINRLQSMYMADGADLSWVSKDIRQPKTLTVITYQALHAAIKGTKALEDDIVEEEDGESDDDDSNGGVADSVGPVPVVDLLKSAGVEAVILDEAHHLRKEWWKNLTQTIKYLGNVTVVSLTATPPYDVSYSEWQKYHELCGSIDEEISVPELVKVGDLCPHQDYIYFSRPTVHESSELEKFQSNVKDFIEAICTNQAFHELLISHACFKDGQANVESILEDPVLFSTSLLLLNHVGFKIPKIWLDIVGLKPNRIPKFSLASLEELLNEVLFTRNGEFSDPSNVLGDLKRGLQRIGAVERRNVMIHQPKKTKKLLSRSVSKLDSIARIVTIESQTLGRDLRMVILADFIRQSDLPKSTSDLQPLANLGVIPIFEKLRRETGELQLKIGVLTGSLMIIPASAKEAISKVATEMGVSKRHIQYNVMDHDPAYIQMSFTGEKKHTAVSIFTECFASGSIQVIVGTAALLGEGWDAPTLNSLVNASYVGSFMLSNQMRGRAIRKDPKSPTKVSNIWHLAAIDIYRPSNVLEARISGENRGHVDRYLNEKHLEFEYMGAPLGEDVETLKRRMLSFEAPSFSDPPVIENGIRRFNLAGTTWKSEEGIADVNNRMQSMAADRAGLAQRWINALVGKSPHPQIVEKIRSVKSPGIFFSGKTIAALMMQAAGFAMFGLEMSVGLLRARQDLLIINIVMGVAMFCALPKSLKALWLTIRNGTLENNMLQVGNCLMESLYQAGFIKTRLDRLRVKADILPGGAVGCYLDGGDTSEKQAFIDAMEEILGPIENPRYLILRKSLLAKITRIDYHSVPEVLASKKNYAELFHKTWLKMVSDGDLIYTRSPAGRAVLLRARMRSLSSAFQKTSDRMKVWE